MRIHFFRSQNGNITLITILLFAIAGVTMLLPVLQGSIISYQNAMRTSQRISVKSSAVAALAYGEKAFVTEGLNVHKNYFAGKSFTISNDFFTNPVTISYDFVQFHDGTNNYGKVYITARSSSADGYVNYTISRAFEYVDLSLFAVYSGGPVENIVPGTFRVVHQGGRTSYYVEEDNARIYAPSDPNTKIAFPIFIDNGAFKYNGDQTIQKWNSFAYRIAQNGSWIIPIRFNGVSYDANQLLEPEVGLVVNIDPRPGFTVKQRSPNSLDNIIRNLYLRNLYQRQNTGAHIYLFRDKLNTKQPMPITMPGGWDIIVEYFPQRNNDPTRPRFRWGYVTDTLHVNFAILYGTVISKTGIRCNVPFKVHIPNSANGNPTAYDWMYDPRAGRLWSLVEEQGLWFCFTQQDINLMVNTLQKYTYNEGPVILTKLYLK
jgi:hypothetical protein